MSSCPTKHLMYSFPWRKNSCAIDSVGACLQMLYTSNLNTEGKEIFGEYCPDLCELFTDLTSGLLATFKAKERLEQLLGDRLWTNQNAFWKFRNHNYEDIDKAFQLYQIRPPTISSSSLPADEHSNIFTASITIADVCRTSGCSAYSVANYEHRILEYMYFPIRSQHSEQLCQLQNCVAATHGPGYCQLCLKPKEIQINQFSGPLLLAMNIYACSNRTNPNPNVPYAPEELHLADTAYALSACIYGDGSHFVALVRDFASNRLLFCDGMTNNAKFVEYKGSAGKFPLSHMKKRLEKAYFVRSEYANFANKR